MFACVCPDKKFMTLNILDEIFIKQPIDTFDVKHFLDLYAKHVLLSV